LEDVESRPLALPAGGHVADEFGRLIQLVRSNERLFVVLRDLAGRLHGVRSYLTRADCNVRLGKAYYQYWRARHSGVLAFLRANRLEARRLLARLDPEALGRCPISLPSLGRPSREPTRDPGRLASRPRPSL
jgi:hypothetical protein